MNVLDKVEMLSRKSERLVIIVNLQNAIKNCDEDNGECDVCLGLRYAIRRIEEMENN
jgi:hypothetical protein